MAAHTPGPWIAVKNKWDEFALVQHATNETIALLDDTEGGDATWPQYEANAHLIAAAPELLDANEEALDTLTKLRADLAEEDAELHAQRIAVIDLTITQLQDAIAKARPV